MNIGGLTQSVLALVVSAVVDDGALQRGVIVVSIHRLHGAVGHDQLNLILAEAAVAALGVEHIRVLRGVELLLIHIDDHAVGIQIDDIVALGGHAGLRAEGERNVLGVLVLGIGQSQVLAQGVLVEGALHGLGLHNGLDLVRALGVGEQDHIVFLEVVGIGLKAGLAAGDGHRSRSVLLGHEALGVHDNIGIGDLLFLGGDGAHIGVDDADGDIVVVLIVEDLNGAAVSHQLVVGAGAGDLDGVALGHGNIIGLDAVVIDLGVLVLLAHVEIAVDITQLHVAGVSHISGVRIGADLVALESPLGGGTGEVVGGLGLVQLVEVALGKLQVGLVHVVVVGALRNFLGLVAGDGHGSAVDVNRGLGVVLDHGGLQHVEGVQGSLLTGHGLGADELVVAVVQADTGSLLDDGHGPVGTGVALNGAVIAQSAQQHLHERIAAQGGGGTEGAVGVAVDDALLRAVGDVACEHVSHGHILEGSGVSAQVGSGGGPQDQVADDLGGGTAGQDFSGLEVAAGITVDNADAADDVDSFLVGDAAVITEVLGAGADGDQRHGHHQSQYQRKELLHWVFTSFKFPPSAPVFVWRDTLRKRGPPNYLGERSALEVQNA